MITINEHLKQTRKNTLRVSYLRLISGHHNDISISPTAHGMWSVLPFVCVFEYQTSNRIITLTTVLYLHERDPKLSTHLNIKIIKSQTHEHYSQNHLQQSQLFFVSQFQKYTAKELQAQI